MRPPRPFRKGPEAQRAARTPRTPTPTPPAHRPLRRCSCFKRFITSSVGSFKKTIKLIFLPVEKGQRLRGGKPSGQASGGPAPAPTSARHQGGPTPGAGSGPQLHSLHWGGAPSPPRGRAPRGGGALRPLHRLWHQRMPGGPAAGEPPGGPVGGARGPSGPRLRDPPTRPRLPWREGSRTGGSAGELLWASPRRRPVPECV